MLPRWRVGQVSEIVWLTEERTFARLVKLGAYYSVVTYARGGIDYEVLIDNEDIEFGADEDDDED